MSEWIYLDAPDVGELEKKYLNETIDAGFISSVGPNIDEFEQRFATFVGCPHSAALQSGTAALHMALYAYGITHDDEVLVPNLTFIASANPIHYVGAKPVFVDVNPHTWNIDPAQLEESITPQTKAIIVVHLYGTPCDMDAILNIAKKHNLVVIEDATESLGSTYQGKSVGTIGDIGCFSFNGNKMITTGSGGMVVSNNQEKIDYIKYLGNQAKDKDKGYFHPEIGFNYRLTAIEAALGLAQLDRFESFLRKKEQFHKIYTKNFKDYPEIQFQELYPNATSCYWLTSALFK
jgi:perosamine synthetase